jgi:hypothetical protein
MTCQGVEPRTQERAIIVSVSLCDGLPCQPPALVVLRLSPVVFIVLNEHILRLVEFSARCIDMNYAGPG